MLAILTENFVYYHLGPLFSVISMFLPLFILSFVGIFSYLRLVKSQKKGRPRSGTLIVGWEKSWWFFCIFVPCVALLSMLLLDLTHKIFGVESIFLSNEQLKIGAFASTALIASLFLSHYGNQSRDNQLVD